jgi:uncharacterized protein YgbK (DUF1537 family)
MAVIAAAIPSAGRTTQNGLCLVNGVPLLETEFASDPKTPVTSSRIAELIALQSGIPVYEVHLEVRHGGLSAVLSALDAEGECMVVVDAVEDRDLMLIAQALGEQERLPLMVGAAGLQMPCLSASLCKSSRLCLCWWWQAQ